MSQRKTVLQQKKIGDVSDALSHFQITNPDQVPIVLIPEDRTCCSCYMMVPTGPHCILHRFGKDINPEKLADAGLQITPPCNRIAYCVTRAACNYNAPVKSCPTADNVMVDCDLTLIFEIGPDPLDVKKFCYKLGARRFDEFLFAAVEEAIRHLIRTCIHTEVYELKGGSDPRVVETMVELNNKFNIFGVRFSSMAITDVRFKRELQETLQQTTEFKSKIQEQGKKQKNEMDAIQYRKEGEMQELDQQNRRIIQDLQAHRTRVEIERKKSQVEAVSKAEVAITKAKQDASVDETKAKSEKQVARAQGLRKKEEILAQIKALDDGTRIRVVQECKSQVIEAQSKRDAAEMISNALMLEAKAEQDAASSLKIKREHELRMAKLEVLQLMAQNNKIVISGDQGDKLIGEMLDKSIMGNIQLAGGN